MRITNGLALLLLGCITPWPIAGAAERTFTPEDILQWEPHSFVGETRYEPAHVDGRDAVHAICEESTASGLFRKTSVDLTETPILEWTWRVDDTYTDIDETTRAGDDYPARIYVVREHSVMRWRTRSLNYVWASQHKPGDDWPNAYLSQNHMIAMRGQTDAGTGWQRERRNLREDFARYHDRDYETITTVAIMTDCDDTGQTAEAWFGTIRFLPESAVH